MSSIIIEEWRDLWSFKVDFVFAALAWSFANSNLVNLTQDCATYGGAAYVVAYGASLLAVCLPLVLMELGVGQLTGRAPVQALFNICPLFKGVGVAQILYCLALMSVYGIHLAYLFLHIFYQGWHIMEGAAPWDGCKSYVDKLGLPQYADCINASLAKPYLSSQNFSHSSAAYFLDSLQQPSANIEEPGQLLWQPAAALGVVWAAVFLAIFAGVRWLGKVCYVTLLIPVILLLALLVKALTLYLQHETITTVLEPDWSALLELDTWSTAFARSIMATGVGFGAYITLGSYNKRNNNLVGDSFLIIVVHVLLAGTQLMTVLMLAGAVGELESDETVPKRDWELFYRLVVAVGQFHLGPMWAAFLLFMVGFMFLNYLYVMSLSLLATLEDAFGEKSSRLAPRLGLALLVSALGYLVGLGHCLQSGKWSVQLMEYFLDKITLWAIIVFEVFAVAYFYCSHVLGKDIKQMVNNAAGWVLGFFFSYWLYLVPAAPVFVIVVKMALGEAPYDFRSLPAAISAYEWQEATGWAIAALPLLPIPLLAIYILLRTCVRGPGLTAGQRLKYALISPLRYEIVKPAPPPRYSASAPGYVLLPQNQWHEMS